MQATASPRRFMGLCMTGVLLLAGGCGALATLGATYASGRELFRPDGAEDSRYAVVFSGDHGVGMSRDMRYRRDVADRDQRIGIRNYRANVFSVSVQRQIYTEQEAFHVGPLLAVSDIRFDAVADEQRRGAKSESVLIGGEILWSPPGRSTLYYARLLGGPTRVSIPQLEEDERLGNRDFRSHSTRISLGVQQPLAPWLFLSAGVALDTTAMPPDAHLNDSLPIHYRMVNSIQALTPHAGLQVQFSF